MKKSLKDLRNFDLFIVLILAIALVSGILIVHDYGLSWDEYRDITYGELVLKAYRGSGEYLLHGTNRYYYGPFHWMLVNLLSRFITSLLFGLQVIHVWKMINFCVFLIGVFAFYDLCRRTLPRTPAIFSMLLLMTQPLLWGHAFINQKDIPMMSFFLLSITAGLHGIDVFNQSSQGEEYKPRLDIRGGIRRRLLAREAEWNEANKNLKLAQLLVLFIIIIIAAELFFLKMLVLPLLQSTIRNAYTGNSIPLINSLFKRIAQAADILPVDPYLEAINRIYLIASWVLMICLILIARNVYRRIFHSRQRDDNQKEFHRKLWLPLAAGIVLGLTISIRVAGIYAGILTSGLFLYKSGRKALIPLIIYWIVAMTVVYATWPYLWGAPIARFSESIQQAGSFSSLKTLFQGEIQASENMPAHYLPFLMLVQLTEPAVLLIILGMIIVICNWRKGEIDRVYLLLVIAWIGIPILAEIVLRVPIYDNFRQFLFIVPPVILISGFGISYVNERVKPHWLAVLLLMIVLLPGIWGIVKLHPYEYAFYNAIVGGIDGAYGEYELDYWCTSLKEAMGYLQENASPNATVYISGPVDAAKPYAREDLKIVRDRTLVPYPDYVVACRNVVLSEEFYPDYQIIHEVGIGQGVFAVIKEKVLDQ